jgi:hypothetical protein
MHLLEGRKSRVGSLGSQLAEAKPPACRQSTSHTVILPGYVTLIIVAKKKTDHKRLTSGVVERKDSRPRMQSDVGGSDDVQYI